jgi:hypothetical protein
VVGAAIALAGLAGCGSKAAPGAAGNAAASTGTAGASTTASGRATVSGSASASATASASPTGTATATAACAAAGLRVRLDTAAAGVAAGSYYIPLEFVNTSGHACRLAGYPAVAFTSGATGQQIGTEAAVDRGVRADTVLLAPGGIAHAWLQVLAAADYPAGKCHPVTAAGLRVVAPGTQSASYIPHQVAACKAVTQGSEILTVQPVQAGQARRGTA